MDGDLVPEARDPEYAKKGAPALSDFMRGVEAAQGDNDSHNTIMGHSYGSTLVGETAKGRDDGAPIADDVIAVGSPGMQVARGNELGVEVDHVWGMASPATEDQVPTVGKIVGLGEDRIVPTDPDFGGNIMHSDSPDHSGHWDGNSTSLQNQAAVISGRYDEVDLDR